MVVFSLPHFDICICSHVTFCHKHTNNLCHYIFIGIHIWFAFFINKLAGIIMSVIVVLLLLHLLYIFIVKGVNINESVNNFFSGMSVSSTTDAWNSLTKITSFLCSYFCKGLFGATCLQVNANYFPNVFSSSCIHLYKTTIPSCIW